MNQPLQNLLKESLVNANGYDTNVSTLMYRGTLIGIFCQFHV